MDMFPIIFVMVKMKTKFRVFCLIELFGGNQWLWE